jgi:hypothetical protein
MALLERTVAELQRRAALLSEEIKAWTSSAGANVNQMGIHKSQFEALKKMMDGLLARQLKLLEELSPEQSPQQFADRYYRLLMEIVGTHDLWRIFRHIFTQLREERLGPLVDAANLIAADSYKTCLDRVRDWGLITEQQFREPPLVYLEADISPATASREKKVQALGFPLRQYRNLRLPIPIVSLPTDYADCLWLFCTLFHEVGHNLEQDLKLARELKVHLGRKLEEKGVPTERRKVWRQWTNEILADVFGVLLGGAGFVYSLTSLLLVVAPHLVTLDTEGEHPDGHIRIYLLTELLRQSGVEALKLASDEILHMWNAQAEVKPAGIGPYLEDGTVVVHVFLSQPLKPLGNRTLGDLAPDLHGDAKRTADLAKYFRTGIGFDEPLQPVPWRLVPVAAQLRLLELDTPDSTALELIQERSIKYLKKLKRPEFLAVADRSQFLSQLINNIDFITQEDI